MIKTVSSDYKMTEEDIYLLVDCSSGNVSITLPHAISKKILIFKKIDTTINVVTVHARGPFEEIDGASSFLITESYEQTQLKSNGINWWIVEGAGLKSQNKVVSKTTGPLIVYVDGLSGSDASGGTQEDPLRTLSGAYGRLPDFINHPVTIHLALHSGSGYQLPTLKNKLLNENIWVVGDESTEILPESEVDSGGTDQIIITSSLADNVYRGKVIEMLSGTSQGDRRTIRNNSTTQIYPVYDFSSTPAVGDTFRLIEPKIIIQTIEDDQRIAQNIGSITGFPEADNPSLSNGLFFENVKFDIQNDIGIAGGLVHFFGCEFFGDNVTTLNGAFQTGFFKIGTERNQLVESAVEDRAASGSTSYVGWGGFFSASVALLISKALFSGYIVAGNVVGFGAAVEIIGGNVGRVQATAGSNGPCTVSVTAATSQDVFISGATRVVQATGPGAYIRLNDVFVTGTSDVVQADKKGHIDLLGDTTILATGGDALRAKIGGTIHFDDGMTAVSETGAEIYVGNGAVSASVADFGSSDIFLAESGSDGSLVQRVS